MAPVGRHLTAAGRVIVFGADGLKKRLEGGDAEHEAEGAVAVIRINPIDAGTQEQPDGGGDALVTCAGNLEIDLILTLELDFAIVQSAGSEHDSVQTDQGLAVQTVKFGDVQLGGLDASLD